MLSDKPKNLLVVQYSQTGQLSRVVDSIIEPLKASNDVNVTCVTVKPLDPYPFPWPFFRFFDVFPESVYLDPPPIEALDLDPESQFDLVILAYLELRKFGLFVEWHTAKNLETLLMLLLQLIICQNDLRIHH